MFGFQIVPLFANSRCAELRIGTDINSPPSIHYETYWAAIAGKRLLRYWRPRG